MNTQYYESLLRKPSGGVHDAEAAWDARAGSFGREHSPGCMDGAEPVTELLRSKGLLAGLDVLDVGGGTGRYAVPFAAHAREVTVTDISGQMLARAKENAEAAGRVNLRYEKLDWEKADLARLGWQRRYDLVFASMCPAVRSRAGIEKMSSASRGYCQVNQMIELTDSISMRLSQDLALEKGCDPHNDRDAVQGIFNLLWICGFEPEITYLRTSGEQTLSPDEGARRYERRFSAAAEAKGTTLPRLLEEYAQDGRITVKSRSVLAMILWRSK